MFHLSLSLCSCWFDSRGSGLDKVIEYPGICLTMLLASYGICLYAFAYNIVELMGGLELYHQDNVYLYVFTRTCWSKWGWCTLEPGLNLQWQIVLALTVPTTKVLVSANCLWCLLWNWFSYKPMLSFPLYFWLCGEALFSGCGDSWYAYFTFVSMSFQTVLVSVSNTPLDASLI
jgi:hypothetical protein